jgi:hypothetical protein
LILGVGLVGLTQGITTALRSGKESELQTQAALLAAGQLETLRAEGYLTEGETTGLAVSNAPFQLKQTVTETALDGLHEVIVEVQETGTGKPVYELRTLLFDPPYSTTNRTNGVNLQSRTRRNR